MENRKTFFKKAAALSLLGTGFLSIKNPLRAAVLHEADASGPAMPMGIAGYTFTNFDIDHSIAMMQRAGITNLSLKDKHLPLTSTPEQIKAVVDKFSLAGIKIYAVGVIYMTTEAEVDRAFDYASKVGVKLIIGVPEYSLIPYVENKIISSGIRLAIHNHGPEDKRYPSPLDVWTHIKDRNAGLGLCMDIGHAMRAGTNPAQAAADYKSRLFDLHIKDVTGAFKEAKAIELGRGVVPIAALVKVLKETGYKGLCSLEYEKDMLDPLPGITESAGYFRGIMRLS